MISRKQALVIQWDKKKYAAHLNKMRLNQTLIVHASAYFYNHYEIYFIWLFDFIS